MIRLILIGIFLFLYLVVFSPALLVLWVIGKISPEKKDNISIVLVKWALHAIQVLAGVKLTVKGYENIPDVPVLYVGNHRSFFDIIILYPLVKGLCGFVAKKELLKALFLRRWMSNVKCLFLDREDPREGMKTIQKGIEQVKNGISMVIYPEGTRNKNEIPMAFKEGSMRIAEKSGCPIVPVAMSGTSEIFEKHLPFVRSAEVVVSFGTPIDVKSLSREEKKTLAARVRDELLKMLPAEYQDKPEDVPVNEE